MRIDQKVYSAIDLRVEGAKQQKMASTESVGAERDHVDLSPEATVMKDQGDVRGERVAEVKARMASGFYDTVGVRERIAEAFMKAQNV